MYKGEDQVIDILSRKRRLNLEQLAQQTGFNEDMLRRILESLKGGGYITTDATEAVLGKPTPEFERYASSNFPEAAVFQKALKGALVSELQGDERSIGIKWAKAKDFVAIENGRLVPVAESQDVAAECNRLRNALNQVKTSGKCDDAVLMEELFERHLIERRVVRTLSAIATGKAYPSNQSSQEANQTDSANQPNQFNQPNQSNQPNQVNRPSQLHPVGPGFDISVPSTNAQLGKNHPITKITNRMRTIMTELGFQEMDGGIIESSFWNFDALFQPQDHPARELADTFYLKNTPALAKVVGNPKLGLKLPDDGQLVNRVKKAHEAGWKYSWDPKEASRAVLRTHTTALSARYVAAIKDKKPCKFYAIGRVFRNEATDYKHLAEFHQVEGILAWEGATFTDLLGILKEFYRKLGFEKIRFRPSFFPYTEPSLEIEVYFEERKQWMELGGAGIFRPEVSIPLAGVYPVLAWGLSLERPLMLALGLDDIRALYRNDVDFLKSSKLSFGGEV